MNYKRNEKIREKIIHTVRYILQNPYKAKYQICSDLNITTKTLYVYLHSDEGKGELINALINNPDIINHKLYCRILTTAINEQRYINPDNQIITDAELNRIKTLLKKIGTQNHER